MFIKNVPQLWHSNVYTWGKYHKPKVCLDSSVSVRPSFNVMKMQKIVTILQCFVPVEEGMGGGGYCMEFSNLFIFSVTSRLRLLES